MNERLTIPIVDDHPLFRRRITSMLETVPHLSMVGEASNGADAVRLAEQ